MLADFNEDFDMSELDRVPKSDLQGMVMSALPVTKICALPSKVRIQPVQHASTRYDELGGNRLNYLALERATHLPIFPSSA